MGQQTEAFFAFPLTVQKDHNDQNQEEDDSDNKQ